MENIEYLRRLIPENRKIAKQAAAEGRHDDAAGHLRIANIYEAQVAEHDAKTGNDNQSGSYSIPSRADLAPILTPEDRADMLARALDVCPDLSDYEVIAGHLHRIGFSLSQVATILDAAIDEARATRAAMATISTVTR